MIYVYIDIGAAYFFFIWILQRGATPAGPPSYSASRISLDLHSPTNTTGSSKMADIVSSRKSSQARHFRSAGRSIRRNGQGNTGTTPSHSSPFSSGRSPHDE